MIIKFSENIRLEIDITDQMRKDWAECRQCAAGTGEGKECDGCSLNVDIFGQAPCELPAVMNKIDIL